jgi:hypothetical protein
VKKGVSVSKTAAPAEAVAGPIVSRLVISARDLCELTGLSDRRHRQLAEKGYFPPPIRGEYQRAETIEGLFKHFRELLAKKDDTLRKEQQKLTRAKREIAQEKLAAIRNEYVRKEEIGPALRNISLHQRSVLQAKLENEIAPNISGLTPVEVRARLAAAVDEICRIFQEGVKSWMDAAP